MTAQGNTEFPWSQRPTLQESYRIHPQLPFSKENIAEFRRRLEHMEPAVRPETRMIHLAGGVSTGSGGGGGVLCFSSASDLRNAFDSRGRLRPHQENLVRRIYVFDYLNQGHRRTGLIQPLRNEKAYDYLQRVIRDFIKPAHPALALRLSEVLQEMSPHRWLNLESLPRFSDTELSPDEEDQMAGCPYSRYVQMAIRYENPQRGRMPQIMIEADYRLLELLHRLLPPEEAVLNEALLLFHETLYLITSETGSWSSRRVHDLNSTLLSQSLYFTNNRRPRAVEEINRDLHELSSRNFAFMSFSGSLVRARSENRFQQADQELMDILTSIGERLGIHSVHPMWSYYLFPEAFIRIANALKSAPPILSFMYQIRQTAAIRNHWLGISVEDIYLKPSEFENLRLFLCRSLELDADSATGPFGLHAFSGAAAQGANITISQRAVQFCRDEGVPRGTREDRGRFLEESRMGRGSADSYRPR